VVANVQQTEQLLAFDDEFELLVVAGGSQDCMDQLEFGAGSLCWLGMKELSQRSGHQLIFCQYPPIAAVAAVAFPLALDNACQRHQLLVGASAPLLSPF